MNKLKIRNKNDITYDIRINDEEVICSELTLKMKAGEVSQLTILEPITTTELDISVEDIIKQKQVTYPQLLQLVMRKKITKNAIIRDEEGRRYKYDYYNFNRLNEKDLPYVEIDEEPEDGIYIIDTFDITKQVKRLFAIEYYGDNQE